MFGALNSEQFQSSEIILTVWYYLIEIKRKEISKPADLEGFYQNITF